MTPVDVERGEARREAVQELLKPQYQAESLPSRVMRYLQQFLDELLGSAMGGVTGGIVAAVILVVILSALVGLLVWWARRASPGGPAPASYELFGAPARSAADHRAAAELHAAESRWSEAIQERLRAVARDLEERAIIDPTPGRTAGELAADGGRALPPLAADLADAARLFNEVTYGEIPGTSAAYGRLADLDDRVRQAKPALAGAGPAAGGPR
ncbi:DUF4129 domain-containing protein [Sinosporangium siamense]|uniref:Protein-glutamine gamma-glutamyltransferase-like C-terminal domain-containing protein n=1 Tax=Sinosporangium siamense TaxID=1367973 RepID=A0A919RFP3_9ACTN|nr:DUF4129 domain-containing protein [Sinosporangium siamense]GII91046.1 hypothetical protein Ssi02_12770 [Sinosporangium siamense]